MMSTAHDISLIQGSCWTDVLDCASKPTRRLAELRDHVKQESPITGRNDVTVCISIQTECTSSTVLGCALLKTQILCHSCLCLCLSFSDEDRAEISVLILAAMRSTHEILGNGGESFGSLTGSIEVGNNYIIGKEEVFVGTGLLKDCGKAGLGDTLISQMMSF